MKVDVLIVFLSLTLLVAVVKSDCGCGTKCFAYSDPSRCTRCCTATVKRSLRHGPDGKPFDSFLVKKQQQTNDYAYPKWSQRRSDDRFLRKLSDILGLMTPPFL